MQYDLGYFDHETCRLEAIENPFSVKVLPMSPLLSVTHVPGMDPFDQPEISKIERRQSVSLLQS